jgi:transcriptional regulator PpsR
VTQAPKGPAEASDLDVLSALAPELAQTFVSIASDIALVIDDAGVIRNVAFGEDPLGGSAADWVGRRWSETVTGETRTKIEQLLAEAQSSGITRRREVNHPTGTGADIPVAYAAVRLGHRGPVLAVGRDLRAVSAIQQRFVDAQQLMERDYWHRRQAEARYRQLFHVATDAVLVVDAATLSVLEANRAAAMLFGRPGAEMSGQPASAGLSGGARAAFDELLVTVRTRGRPGEIRTRGALDASGRPLLLDIAVTPFRADGDQLLLVRARAVDADVHGAATRLADFVERTPDAVVIADSAGRVLIANPAFLALCRAALPAQAHANPVGHALAELLGDPRDQWRGVLAEARRGGLADMRRVAAGVACDPLALEVSIAMVADGDQECLGLTMRRVDQRLEALPPQVGELAAAIDRLAAQVGLATLPELLQETTELAERHLLEAALARAQGDRLQAAQLLGIGADNLWLRLRHHGLDRSGGDPAAPTRRLN